MPQPTPYAERKLAETVALESRRWPCDHEVVWVVDLSSRRVIRGACTTCAVDSGAMPPASVLGLALIR